MLSHLGGGQGKALLAVGRDLVTEMKNWLACCLQQDGAQKTHGPSLLHGAFTG